MKMKINYPLTKGYYFRYLDSVYKDPEFLDEINKIKKLMAEYTRANPKHTFFGTEATTPPSINKVVSALASDFEINEDLIWNFIDFNGEVTVNTNKILTYYDSYFERIIIEMDPDLTQEEFIGFWSLIESAKKKSLRTKQRLRGNENPQLLYAIYRAKKKGKTFKEIAQLINDKQLENYNDYYRIEHKTFDYGDVKELYYPLKKGKIRP
jgi:hypothetical protein